MSNNTTSALYTESQRNLTTTHQAQSNQANVSDGSDEEKRAAKVATTAKKQLNEK
jgi:hypothetical protein